MVTAFGDTALDALSPSAVERFLDGLLVTHAQATRNRYRTTLHAMLNRAIRHGLLTANPVTGIANGKEPEGRLLWLTREDEESVREQLAPTPRPRAGDAWTPGAGICEPSSRSAFTRACGGASSAGCNGGTWTP